MGSTENESQAGQNSIRTSFTDLGMGEHVILLHCSGASSHQWHRVVDVLKDRCHLIMPDLRGYGGTDGWDIRRSPSLMEEVAGIVRLAQSFPGKTHLVGHSYGGAVAMLAAAEYSKKFTSVTAIEPANWHLLREGSFGDREMYTQLARLAMTLANAAAIDEREVGLERFVDYWSGAGTWASISEEARKPLCKRVETIVFNLCAVLGESASLKSLTRHALPTLMMYGENTVPAAKRVAGMFAENLAVNRYVEVEGAGHMLPQTHPTTVANQIIDHVGRSSAIERMAA